jgi:hypothetical protein
LALFVASMSGISLSPMFTVLMIANIHVAVFNRLGDHDIHFAVFNRLDDRDIHVAMFTALSGQGP